MMDPLLQQQQQHMWRLHWAAQSAAAQWAVARQQAMRMAFVQHLAAQELSKAVGPPGVHAVPQPLLAAPPGLADPCTEPDVELPMGFAPPPGLEPPAKLSGSKLATPATSAGASPVSTPRSRSTCMHDDVTPVEATPPCSSSREGVHVAFSELDHCTRVDWHVAQSRSKMQKNAGKPLVSPAFDVQDKLGMRMLLCPNSKGCRSKHAKGLSRDVRGDLKLKAPHEGAGKVNVRVVIGDSKMELMKCDFLQQPVITLGQDLEWSKFVDEETGHLTVSLEFVADGDDA